MAVRGSVRSCGIGGPSVSGPDSTEDRVLPLGEN
jgi:hypothetical protein